MAVDLALLLDPGYLGDLPARPMEEVRAMRAECQQVETGLSLLRRLVQGRLDIVGIELTRRANGDDPADLADLIARLPEVLSDRTHAPGLGRLPQMMSPGDLPAEFEAELDAIIGGSALSQLSTQTDEQLRSITDRLAELEVKVSGQRHALFGKIDALQAEITRRYKTGEASVESLL
ncbi:MAG: aerial mycelium formation protein [Acidimicrobiia bacterium]|nr:aerial mycelium formation protein [Acidimicrobiia bacterium]